jgi:hypothetical protein
MRLNPKRSTAGMCVAARNLAAGHIHWRRLMLRNALVTACVREGIWLTVPDRDVLVVA